MNGQCCAKCRRGIKGYGDLPCGYNGACSNGCHDGQRSAERVIVELNGGK